jgi:hypothetical protein
MKHHSRGARKIANVHCLFDHVTKSYCNASCIVFAYLIIGECIRFPVGWRVYKKNGKSKWRLAIEILDDVLEMDLTIAVVLFDSWFCVRGFVKELERRKLTFVGDMKSSNVLEYRHPEGGSVIRLTMEKLLRCGRFLFKDVCLGLKSSRGDQPNKVLYRTYSKVACVAAFGGKYLIVHSVDQRTKASKTFVCNELSWEAQKVLEEYSYRWMIEEFFGNAKGLCGLEKACIRSEQGGALALFLVSYVDLLVSVELWKSVHNHSKGNIPTVSAIFAAAAEENLRSFIENPGAEDKLEGIFAFWLENLQMTRKKVRRSRLLLVEMAGIKREGVINDSVNASISQLAPTG